MKTPGSTVKAYDIAATGIMMCIIMVSVAVIRIPIPFTQGFINLSDAMIFMGVIILGCRYGTIAAGLGCMLGDLLSGFPVWAPWTLVIKGVMALIFGLILKKVSEREGCSEKWFITFEIVGMVLAGLFMCAGYYFAEGVMYGNWVVAALGIPWNIGQFLVGTVLALILGHVLEGTSLRGIMAFTSPRRAETAGQPQPHTYQ